MKILIYEQDYTKESLADVERDVREAFDLRFNEVLELLPVDGDGFLEGVFTVTINWEGKLD
jgi:hypothetical protein